MVAGVDLWHTAAVPRLGIPALKVTDGPAGARGERWTGRASASFPCGTALGATWNPALVRTVGERIGRRSPAQGRARAARAHRQHSPSSARRSQLRVLLRRPVPHRAHGRAVHLRRAVGRCRMLGEALRGQRLRVRAHDDQLRARRAHAARDLARAVRGGGARSAHVVGDGGVQPFARHVLQRAPAARRPVEGRVGVRRCDHVGLVRHPQHGAGRQRRARSRDARAGAVLRLAPRRRGARGRRERGDPRREGAAHAAPARTDRWARHADFGPEQSIDDPEDRAVARRAATESFVLL